MNTISRWCFLALLSFSLIACEKDGEDEAMTTDVNDPSTKPSFSATGNWNQAVDYTGEFPSSFRADHYLLTLNSPSDLRSVVSSDISLKYRIVRSDGTFLRNDNETSIDRTDFLKAGNYEVIVLPDSRMRIGSISYSLQLYGDITTPTLTSAKTEQLSNQTLPQSGNNSQRAGWLYYSVQIGSGQENDAIDFAITSDKAVTLQLFREGIPIDYWNRADELIGKDIHGVSVNKEPNKTYYFRVGLDDNNPNSIPPGTMFDLSVNARSFTLTSHGTNDPT
ncbi:MAG: hypothetical protein RIC95_09430 [Vicingaceae bacterium]